MRNSGLWSPPLIIWLLIILFTLLNIAVSLHLGFSVDGAHYALYGRYLDWSYFDHPPLVGWMQALLLQFGQQDYGMRLWPLLLSVATPLSLYYIAPRILPHIHKYFAESCVLAYYTLGIICITAIELIPQKPLLLLSLWISYVLFCISQNAGWRHWIVMGLLLGIAGLAEYTAVLLAIGVAAYLFLYQRQQLLTFKPYVAGLIALIGIAPVIYWNWQHQWISFLFQIHHGFGEEHWSGLSFISSLGEQVAAYGVGLFIFGLLGAWQAITVWKDVGSRILVCLALPVLLIFFYSGGYNVILPYWPGTGWLLLVPLAVRYIFLHWRDRWVRVLTAITLVLMFLLYVVVYTQIFWSWWKFPVGKSPLKDYYGWSQAAEHAKKISPHIFVNDHNLASRLAWYAKLPVQVASDQQSQFSLWFAKPGVHAEGVLVTQEGRHKQPEQFATCNNAGNMPVIVNGQQLNTIYFYRCKKFNG